MLEQLGERLNAYLFASIWQSGIEFLVLFVIGYEDQQPLALAAEVKWVRQDGAIICAVCGSPQ